MVIGCADYRGRAAHVQAGRPKPDRNPPSRARFGINRKGRDLIVRRVQKLRKSGRGGHRRHADARPIIGPTVSTVVAHRRLPALAAQSEGRLANVTDMRVLLLSMPDSFEHTPALTMRMPNGALA